MFKRSGTTDLHTNQLDPEHDLDLVALFNNARTDQDVREVMLMTRNRMRARQASLSTPSLRAFNLRRRG
jgi:hypothetical protein